MLGRTLVVTAAHDWGVDGTKARLTERFVLLRSTFRIFFGTAELTWCGNLGRVTVDALGQTVTALCEVQPKELRILVKLPWLLSGLAGPIATFLESHEDVLKSNPQPGDVRPAMRPLGYHHRLLWVYRRLLGFASREFATPSKAA